MRRSKAFTLIELLVVVAIIGILAAVGVVAYNGYTGAAKVSATKSNYKTVIKSLKSELMKCNNGISNTIFTLDPSASITCPIPHSNDLIAGVSTECSNSKGLYYSLKNPYNTKDRSCRINTTLTSDADLGYINWSKKNATDVIISTCWKTPCSDANNFEITTVNVTE